MSAQQPAIVQALGIKATDSAMNLATELAPPLASQGWG